MRLIEGTNIIDTEDIILSMANRRKFQTGLPVNIWIDEKKGYIAGGHGKRIKFQTTYANGWVNQGEASMNLKGEVIPDTYDKTSSELSIRDIREISNFVKNNAYALDKVADGYIFMDQFDDVMIKGGELASEEVVNLQKTLVDKYIELNESEK